MLHAQKTFVEKKGLTNIHFSREYPCIEFICEKRYKYETQLKKHKIRKRKSGLMVLKSRRNLSKTRR